MSRLSQEDIKLKEKIKERMISLLNEYNLRQANYADKANIERQHINRWVNPNSNRGISIYSIRKFCITLEISLKDFFDSPLFET